MGYIIGFFVAEVVFFIAFIIFSRLNYRRRFSNVYDHRNMFPYELNYESRFSDNLVGNICFLFFVGLHLGVAILCMDSLLNEKLIFNLITTILYSVSVLLVLFVPLKLLKTHLICSTFIIGASFLSFASIGYTLLTLYEPFGKSPTFIVLSVISFVVAIFYFILVMNPKLSSWAKVDKVEQDGKTIYQRPKVFYLALCEWFGIFGLPLAGLLMSLTFILIN